MQDKLKLAWNRFGVSFLERLFKPSATQLLAGPPEGTRPHQSICLRSRKNPPVGPFSSSVASQMAVSAPSSGDLEAADPPMRVRTQPGHIAFTLTLRGNVLADATVKAFKAALATP